MNIFDFVLVRVNVDLLTWGLAFVVGLRGHVKIMVGPVLVMLDWA